MAAVGGYPARGPLRGLMALALAAVTGLTGCDVALGPSVRDPELTRSVPPSDVPFRSLRSAELQRHYERVQANLLAKGLMRTDGGGPDTPYDAATLAKNFETIAFYDEYARGAGLSSRGGKAGRLRRWEDPVRVTVGFGNSVPQEVRLRDRQMIAAYTERLAGVTEHPITMSPVRPNFHVLFMSEDDKEQLIEELRVLVPDVTEDTLDIFRNLPRSIYCLVVASSPTGRPNTYHKAIALVRAEHPDLVRLSCVHEEMAQGLGLANDDPRVRPSIFNDDDEFALLTSHDEHLLRILYDPRLRPGMTLERARPIIQTIARELMGQNL